MVKACCPGSFDPVTNGHIDVFTRAAALFDNVTVGVLINKKKSSLFTVAERMEMLREVCAPYPNITIDAFHGLLVDYCREQRIAVVVKGLRAVTDFDYELQMAQMNHRLSGVETLFLATNPEYGYLSSSLVKEIATYGGDVTGLLPDPVLLRVREKIGERAS
jgi:pantetheine-phosphate adenylyltransferase